MEKAHIIPILISSLIFIANAQSLFQGSEKIAKFRVYLQDAISGPNATVYVVAQANITSTSPTEFGQIRVTDTLVTAEPDPNSEELGRAQGLVALSGLEEVAFTMNLNFIFTVGKYKRSTICIVGRNPIFEGNRELPIVGGTGVFRWARGFAISNTYFYDSVTNYAILEYDLHVVYVEQELGFGLLAKEDDGNSPM